MAAWKLRHVGIGLAPVDLTFLEALGQILECRTVGRWRGGGGKVRGIAAGLGRGDSRNRGGHGRREGEIFQTDSPWSEKTAFATRQEPAADALRAWKVRRWAASAWGRDRHSRIGSRPRRAAAASPTRPAQGQPWPAARAGSMNAPSNSPHSPRGPRWSRGGRTVAARHGSSRRSPGLHGRRDRQPPHARERRRPTRSRARPAAQRVTGSRPPTRARAARSSSGSGASGASGAIIRVHSRTCFPWQAIVLQPVRGFCRHGRHAELPTVGLRRRRWRFFSTARQEEAP